ncbi:hypothetical protein G5C51_04370 [Streptomyces sp. A7024]|uniref:Uncharacterized protein n=1 Tax=Streptomyces coryli TaxID=1128680 RepID=A0A6G4TTN8_9ACTN|nr:hypothetical protein [Streptomyces coryli]NGN63142.1 hypothetical protein [Streptomyces coryli]
MPDMYNGRPLPERSPVLEDIHYRLYDQRTGAVLSINTTNCLDVLVKDVIDTCARHPEAELVAVQYDGPAWDTGGR